MRPHQIEKKKNFFTLSEENGERAELDTLFLRTRRSFIVVHRNWSFILFVVTNRDVIIIIIT